ncbi:MAG: hypothetical protein AAGJ94_08095 [Pseudomonadota bacterium]
MSDQQDETKPAETEAEGTAKTRADRPMRLGRVQTTFAKAMKLDDTRRQNKIKQRLGLEVLTAIAKGDVPARQAQRFAQAATGIETPETEEANRQREERRAERQKRRAAETEAKSEGEAAETES